MTAVSGALTARGSASSRLTFSRRGADVRNFEERRARPYAGWWRVLLFAAPFAAVAAVSFDGQVSEAHRLLLAQADDGIDRFSSGLVPLSIASMWPVNGWLVAVGVVTAGATLRMLARGLVDRGLAQPLVWLLLATVALNPGFHQLVSGDLALLLLLAVALVALAGTLNFSEQRVTADGFFAGIALGIGVVIDPAVILLCLVAGGWVFAITWFKQRSNAEPLSAASSALTVIAFPAVVALVSVACLGWVSGAGFGVPFWDEMSMPSVTSLSSAVREAGAAALVSPLYLVAVLVSVGAVVRRPATLGVHLVPLVFLVTAGTFGLELPREFSQALLVGTAVLFIRPAALVGQLDLALVAVLQVAVGLALATGQI